MKKMQIILLLAAGLLSFLSAFGVSYVLKKNKTPAVAADLNTASADEKTPTANADSENLSSFSIDDTDDTDSSGISENHLKLLIADIRQKMQDYKTKQNDLEQESQRIEIAKKSLQEEIERLNELQEKLNMTMTTLNEKEQALKQSVVEINAIEKTNLQRIAATYDKMDSAQAGKILNAMVTNNQIQDAVKILYYMSERAAGKLIGEISSTSPDIAGTLSLQLKHIKEQK